MVLSLFYVLIIMNKISIITANRNNAEGLERTIKSVITQTYTNYEFIIIDGNSTDNSVNIIKKYSEHISSWVSEKDSGVFNAMNKGIGVATGDYCYFLNSSDTLVDNGTLKNIFNNKEYSAPFINGNQINDYGNGSDKVLALHRPITLFDFYKGTIKHQATFICRDLFNKYGLYDEKLKIVSDWKFFLEVIALNNEQPVFVDEDIVVFEWFGMSTNTQLLEKQKQERSQVLEELLPESILSDYQLLDQLSNYNDLANAMKSSKLLNFLVRGLYKTFRKLKAVK